VLADNRLSAHSILFLFPELTHTESGIFNRYPKLPTHKQNYCPKQSVAYGLSMSVPGIHPFIELYQHGAGDE